MTKHAAIDETRLRAAVQAIKERKPPDTSQVRLSQHPEIAKLRRNLGKKLEPVFAKAGFDISKVNQLLAHHQTEVRRLLEKEKAKTSKEFAEINRSIRQGIENKRKAIQQIASKPYLVTPIPVLTPFFIYALPAGMLNDSHTEPSNNWARISYTDSVNTNSTAKLSFYFAWQNPSNYLAVINCNADLVSSGFCLVDANPGFFSGGSASLNLWAELNVYLGETAITWQTGQRSQIASLSADGGNVFSGIGPVVSEAISNVSHLSCTEIEVQGDQLVVFEVGLFANISIDDGNIAMSFDTPNEILCPALNIELLTAPVAAA
jgi:hypothetical protein